MRERGPKAAIINGLAVVAAKLVYMLPYLYIYYLENGLDTGEALLTSLLFSILSVLGTYVYSLLLFGVGLLFVRRIQAKEKKHSDFASALGESLAYGGAFDFDLRSTGLIFCVSLVAFLISLYSPIYDTVNFFIRYGSTYEMNEILSIMVDFVVYMILFVVTYVLLVKFKNQMAKASDACPAVDSKKEKI